MKSKSLCLVLLLLFLIGNAYGQLLNGDFSNQGAFWDKKSADIPGSFSSCFNSLSADTWSSSDFLWRGGANDWAAILPDWVVQVNSVDRKVCTSISQDLIVPPGTNLVFELRLGDAIAPPVTPVNFNPVDFEANVKTSSANQQVYFNSGESDEFPCTTCLDWSFVSADVADFWGQSATLEFFAESVYNISPFPGSIFSEPATPAYIDNIRFEEIPANPSAAPIAGSWYNPSRNGNGINISRSPTGQLQLLWLTYLPNGTPVWFISSLEPISQGRWNATLDKPSRDPVSGTVLRQPVGSAEIRMLSNNELIFEWTLTAASGSASQGGERMIHLFGGNSFTGLWNEPAFSGWGVTLDVEGTGSSTVTVATIFFYTPSGEPIWAQGVGTGDLTQNVTFNVDTFTGIGLCPGCAGQSQSLQVFPAGSFGLQNLNTQPAGFSAIQTTGGIPWIRGSASSPVSLARLTLP